jgi:hypothetical protein
MSDEKIINWDKETRKREQWDNHSGYWPSYRGGLEATCKKCTHWKGWHCELIPSLVNQVDLFSGCKLKEEAVEK